MGNGKKSPQIFAAMCVCIGAASLGSVIGWTANITDLLKEGKLNNILMDDEDIGWVGSLMPLGATFACFPAGVLSDKIGRKMTALLTVIPFAMGWAFILFSINSTMIFIGRFLCGFAGGCFSVCAPLYNSEIAQVEIRGMLGTFFQLFITFGILYAQIAGYLLPIFWYNISCSMIPVLFGILFMFQPESPVYDLKKGNTEKVKKTFIKLRGQDYDHFNEFIVIKKHIEEESSRTNFFEAMKKKASKKATMICFMLMLYQQMSGINAVMFYAGDIFLNSDTNLEGKVCTISIGVVQVIATIISTMVIDKFGRKMLLLISAIFMTVGTSLIGLYFSLKNHEVLSNETIKSIGWLPVTSLNVFIIAFSVGFGPIPWLASGEMFSDDIKGKCSSGAATFNWLLAFLVTKLYPSAAVAVGPDITFYFFTAVLVSGIFFVVFAFHETKGKTSAEIQEILGG